MPGTREGRQPAKVERPYPAAVPSERVNDIAQILKYGPETILLIGGAAFQEEGICNAQRIGNATAVRVIGDRVNGRLERGEGRPMLERIPYVIPEAVEMLSGAKHMILAGATVPVGFFAYPDLPSITAPPDCEFHVLAEAHEDVLMALSMLAEEISAPNDVALAPSRAPSSAHRGNHYQ